MRKRIAMLIVMAAIAAAGCSNSGSDSTTASAENTAAQENNGGSAEASDLSDKTIVVAIKSSVNPFWVEVGDAAVAKGQELGVNVEVVAPVTANSNEEQIQVIEQAIVQGCDCLVIAPVDSEGIASAVETANAEGIPVVNLNTQILADGVKVETFVATENYDVGFETATALAEAMGGEGNVIIIQGVPGQQNSIDRTAGAEDAFGGYEGITIIDSQIANDNRSEAMTMMQDLLQKHSDIDAVLAVNGEMTLGAAEAVFQAGKTGEILVGGIDVTDEIISAIQEGKITLTNDGQGWLQAETAIQAAYDILSGKEVEDRIVVETAIVSADNLDEYLQ